MEPNDPYSHRRSCFSAVPKLKSFWNEALANHPTPFLQSSLAPHPIVLLPLMETDKVFRSSSFAALDFIGLMSLFLFARQLSRWFHDQCCFSSRSNVLLFLWSPISSAIHGDKSSQQHRFHRMAHVQPMASILPSTTLFWAFATE